MASSNAAPGVRARTHTEGQDQRSRPTSENAPRRPSLRIVTNDTTPPAHTEPAPPGRLSDHLTDALDAAVTHPVAATHPPTVADAIRGLWIDPDQVRHGLVGQIAAAAVGLIQIAGLTVCWQTAHVCFATKTRTAISLIVTAVASLAWAVAAHA